MNWPLNHMVAPKEKAVSCEECHAREGGRLAVGEAASTCRAGTAARCWTASGTLLVLGTLAGVVVHGGARAWFWRRRQGGK